MKKVKITVLRKEFYPELADEYLTDGKKVGPCQLLDVGNELFLKAVRKCQKGFALGHGLTYIAVLVQCHPVLLVSLGTTKMDKL